MNDAEYNQVRLRLRNLFPSLWVWFKELPDDEGNSVVEAIRERWRWALMPLELCDVMEAIKQLSTQGTDPWPYSSDKERAGAIIADRVRQTKAEQAAAIRAARRTEKNPDLAPRGRDDFPVGKLFRLVTARIAQSHRHSAECLEYRQRTGRCLPGCSAPRDVADEVLAEWETCEQLGRVFEFEQEAASEAIIH